MALILCLETSTHNCSAGLGNKGEPVGVLEGAEAQYSHSEKLHQFIDDLLKKYSVKPTELEAVAISRGPGSYTGLRIGVSAAKGLCYALELPLIALDTLDVLACNFKNQSGYIAALMHARKTSVYCKVYSTALETVQDFKLESLKENSFSEFLEKDKVYFLGSGASNFKEITSHSNALFPSVSPFPSAGKMHQMAFKKFSRAQFENLSYFKPFYGQEYRLNK